MNARLCLLLLFLGAASACASTGAQPSPQGSLRPELAASELFRRGEVSAKLGDLTRAEQYFVSALKAGGDEQTIIRRLLVVCVADQRYPVAAQYAQEHLRRHPGDTDVRFVLASILGVLGDVGGARELLEEVVKKRPEWSEPHFALATILRQQGTAVLADRYDRRYLELEPEGPLALRVRARLSRLTP